MCKVQVSVIIPIYNSEKYLKQTLESVLNQSLKNIEIICVDDGSTDNSVAIIEEYCRKDKRIKLLFQKKESNGAALARNMGVEHATGKYLSILDSDDLFKSNMLEILSERMDRFDAEIAICNMYEMRGEKCNLYSVEYDFGKKFLPTNDVFSGFDVKDHLMQIKSGCAWSCMFLRDFIISNNIRFRPVRYTDDLEFTFIALSMAERIVAIDERLIYYRIEASGNQSSTKVNYPEIGYLGYAYLKKELVRRGLYESFKRSYVNKAIRNSIGHLNVIRKYEVAKELYYALKQKYLCEMDAFGISDDEYYDKNVLKHRNLIAESESFEEYLFLASRVNEKIPQNAFRVPKAIIDKAKGRLRVVIYGAGYWGTRVYYYAKGRNEFDVVAWLDKAFYEKSLVSDPKDIVQIDFDMVFVAIVSERTFIEVKMYLLELGIEERKIVWMVE